LLLGASAAAIAVPGTAHAQSGDTPGFNPRTAWFTIAERDRRWAAVRAIMAKPQWNLDAIITTGSDLPGNYARYLTQIGGRGGGGDGPEVIFTRDAAQTTYSQVGGARFRDFWKKHASSWTTDGKLVISDASGAEALAKQMAEQGLNRAGARIGVAKLAGSRFEPEGLVASTYLENLKKALPGVVFVPVDKWGSDAGPIEDSAMIKGPEEQAVIRQAVAASEYGVSAMVAAIKAGAKTQGDLWFATFTA